MKIFYIILILIVLIYLYTNNKSNQDKKQEGNVINNSNISESTENEIINKLNIGQNNERNDIINAENTKYIRKGHKLVGTNDINTFFSVSSIALSSDGSTIAVSDKDDNNNLGATWIFIRSGDTWIQEGDKLLGSGYIGDNINQGKSIALSGDGNTLAIGGYNDNNGIGATWIFTRSNGKWEQQGNKLVGTGYKNETGVNQGNSITLSNDGNILAVGGNLDNNNIGATWIFTRSGGNWTQQGDKLVGSGYINMPKQGTSVILSSDGSTLAIGGPDDNNNIGAVWIFVRSGNTWQQQGTKLVGTDYIGNPKQGGSVVLSSDGNTLAFGGIDDGAWTGGIWIFTRSENNWTQQGEKLVVKISLPNGGSIAKQGKNIALSGDGNILVGNFSAFDIKDSSFNYRDSSVIFNRSNNKWILDPKLVRGEITSKFESSSSIALSLDGNILVMGREGGYSGNITETGGIFIFSQNNK